MGSMASSQTRVNVIKGPNVFPRSRSTDKGEAVVAALARLDLELQTSERGHPAARLAVVAAEMDSILQEINSFDDVPPAAASTDDYAKTMHQLFVSMDLYRRPMLAIENEDFIANVNRKEIRRLELQYLRDRLDELQKERRSLNAQISRTRALYTQLQQLIESIWPDSGSRPGAAQQASLARAAALRSALAAVSARLRAAAAYARAHADCMRDALPAWGAAGHGKSGWERTLACAQAVWLLVRARCAERGTRRVLGAPAAPRAARELRLALDYAFTDAVHDHRYQRAVEVFTQFKDAVTQLSNTIHQVLLSNLENLAVAEKDEAKCRRELRIMRINAIVKRGLGEVIYEPKPLRM